MKKKILFISAIVCFVAIAGASMLNNSSKECISGLLSDNIEALASSEADAGGGAVAKRCAGDDKPNEYGCYANNHGSTCKKQGDCR